VRRLVIRVKGLIDTFAYDGRWYTWYEEGDFLVVENKVTKKKERFAKSAIASMRGLEVKEK
jgi:hypothetical protein